MPRLRRCPDLSPRDPSGSALHAVVRDHLATFLRERDEDAPLPGFVTDELRGLLDCGVLAKGCAPPPNNAARAVAAASTAWWRSRARAAASALAASAGA